MQVEIGDAPASDGLFVCYVDNDMLPARLRGKIWVNFAPGQEVSKTPATNYVETAREVREWIYENYPETCPRPKLEYDL